jgi:hypothetical protein
LRSRGRSHLEIYFIPPPHRRSLFGVLRPYIDKDILERTKHMDWDEIREEAWSKHVLERYSNEDDWLIR